MSRRFLSSLVLIGISASSGFAQQPPPVLPEPPVIPTAPIIPPGPVDPPVIAFGNLDFLNWRVSGMPAPGPLLTTGLPGPKAGALGVPGTSVLHGNDDIDGAFRSGFRAVLAYRPSDFSPFWYEIGLFNVGSTERQYSSQSNSLGQPILAAPFIDALNGTQSALLLAQGFGAVATDPLRTGSFLVNYQSRLRGWNVAFAFDTAPRNSPGFVFTGGYRSLLLEESMLVQRTMFAARPTVRTVFDQNEESEVLVTGTTGSVPFGGVAIPVGNSVSIHDSFRAENRFDGADVGVRYLALNTPLVSISFDTSLAMGISRQTMIIDGMTVHRTGSGAALGTLTGGFNAVGSNIGRYDRSVFAVVSQVGTNLSVNLTGAVALRMGYSVMYWSDVVRATSGIDPVIHRGQVPADPAYGTRGPARPAFAWRSGDLFAQGAHIGIEIRR